MFLFRCTAVSLVILVKCVILFRLEDNLQNRCQIGFKLVSKLSSKVLWLHLARLLVQFLHLLSGAYNSRPRISILDELQEQSCEFLIWLMGILKTINITRVTTLVTAPASPHTQSDGEPDHHIPDVTVDTQSKMQDACDSQIDNCDKSFPHICKDYPSTG